MRVITTLSLCRGLRLAILRGTVGSQQRRTMRNRPCTFVVTRWCCGRPIERFRYTVPGKADSLPREHLLPIKFGQRFADCESDRPSHRGVCNLFVSCYFFTSVVRPIYKTHNRTTARDILILLVSSTLISANRALCLTGTVGATLARIAVVRCVSGSIEPTYSLIR